MHKIQYYYEHLTWCKWGGGGGGGGGEVLSTCHTLIGGKYMYTCMNLSCYAPLTCMCTHTHTLVLACCGFKLECESVYMIKYFLGACEYMYRGCNYVMCASHTRKHYNFHINTPPTDSEISCSHRAFPCILQ